MRHRRSALVATVVAAATLGLAAPAYALWSVTSSNASATAAAGQLGTPAVSAAASGGTVTITVSGAPSTGPAPSGYRVARTAPTSVSSVCAISGSTGSCVDSSPAAGTNTYAVYAKLGTSWESATPATASASGDTTAPTTTITFPAAGGTYNAAGWTGTITGTATDNVAVQKTEVAIRNAAGSYWTGTSFSGSTLTWVTATNGTGSAWSYALARPADGSYTVQARSTDTASNTSTPVSAAFTIDTTVPTVGINTGGYTTPVNSVNVSTAAAAGTVEAGATVQVTVSDGASHSVTAGATVSGTTWSASGLNLTTLNDGSITYTAKATDVAGNTATASVTATKDVVPPALTAVSSGGGATPNRMEAGDTLVLTFSKPIDTGSVPASVTVSEIRAGNSSNGTVTLSIPGLIADVVINTGYVTPANRAAASAPASVTWSAGDTVATVTLGAVSGQVDTGTGGATITPATGVKDSNGNPPSATGKPLTTLF